MPIRKSQMLPSARATPASRWACIAFSVAACVATLSATKSADAQNNAARATAGAADSLPARLSDAEFWRLIGQISETEGSFPSDNFTSNESEVGPLSGLLRSRGRTGGVYMGVGPEQNFSYIAALRPKMAFILDIRRQAMVHHLMYKAIFELAPTRADFVSLLFSRPRPSGLAPASTVQNIWSAYSGVAADRNALPANLTRIRDHLMKTHGFALTAEELSSLNYIYESFFNFGPQIGTRGPVRGRGGRNLSFMTLTLATAPDGSAQSFLASEANYGVVRDLHLRNLLVPVSGDFGGAKALRAVAGYVESRGAKISAFYLSNVEQYLFQDNKWRQFYSNVATLPVDSNSVFIRPYSMRQYAIATSLCGIAEFLRRYSSGRVTSNRDALACAM